MDDMDFASYAARAIAPAIPRVELARQEWLKRVVPEWAVTHGLRFATLPLRFVPDKVLRQEGGREVEYELLRVTEDVPIHYHKHSGGVIYILPNGVGESVKAYLKYKSASHNWHSIPPEGGLIALPAETEHGFRCTGMCDLLILSVNVPPLDPADWHLTN